MRQGSRSRYRFIAAPIALLGLSPLLATQVNAAAITYNFDVNGATTGFGVTTGSTYDWDSTTNGGFWSNNATSSTGNIATIGWSQGNFPKFQPATPAPTYTVTVSNDEQVTGTFFSTAQTVVVNPIGSGTLEAINTTAPNPQDKGSADGFLGSTSADVTFNVPISGAGAIEPSNGGNLRFNASNTYSGGTFIVSTSTLVHFGNDSAFGTGPINLAIAGFAPLLGSGGATRTIANSFVNQIAGGGVNFGADASTPVVSTGTWSLGAFNLVLRNNAGPTAPVTLSNVISGTAGIALSTNTANSTVIFSGANTYSGTTTITGVGGTGAGSSNIRLTLGASNTIASSSSVVLAGGILDPDGLNQNMSATTLGLLTSTAVSTIDFGAGASEVDFANSSALNWTGTLLNLANWNPAVDKLRFDSGPGGLTPAQVAKIEFNGVGKGTAFLDANGFVSVPEPGSISLLGLGAVGLLRRKRRA